MLRIDQTKLSVASHQFTYNISGPPVNFKGKIKEGKFFFVLKLFNSHWFYNLHVNVKNRINLKKIEENE